MWPFKKKVEKNEIDWRIEKVKELREFRAIGDKFKYLGVEMIVFAHHYSYASVDGPTYRPLLRANYVNKEGDIRIIEFEYEELDAVKRENL